jgi:large subunit ribosomal protein L25
METVELSVESRERTGKENAAKVRQAGMVPAVLYGAGEDARALAVSDAALQKLFRGAGSHFLLLSLKVKGKDGERAEHAIIKAVQRHPVNEHIIHVDFLRVSLKKEINVAVPVRVEGIAPGVTLGGVLQVAARLVRVHCLPTQVPDCAVADVSALNIGGVLHARDLKLPEGVQLHADPALTVLSIVAVRVEEEAPAPGAEGEAAAVAAPAPGEAPAQPEVIGEKERDERRLKKDEEKTVKEAEKKEIKEARKSEEKKK